MTSNNANELVQKGLRKISEEKTKLELKKPEWKTSCVIDLFGKDVNIQVCTDVFLLVRARNVFKEVLKDLRQLNNTHLFPVNYRSQSIVHWIEDIERRLQQISVTDKLNKFSQVEAKLTSLLTEDQKRENELNRILESFPDLFK